MFELKKQNIGVSVAGLGGETSAYELNNLINAVIPLSQREDIGDVIIDFSNAFNPNRNGGYILNIGDNTPEGLGTHWTATFKNTNSKNQQVRDGVYFDSYGVLPPKKIADANFDYTTLHLQSYELREEFCGQWCVLFLKFCYEDNLAGFYSNFQNLALGSLA